jgi:hypothetical protein
MHKENDMVLYASGKKGGDLSAGLGPLGSYAKATFFGAGSLNGSTWTKLPFAGATYDNLNEVDTVTNKRWTATADGVYRITAVASLASLGNVVGAIFVVRVYKNGASQLERSMNGREQGTVDNLTVAIQATVLELTAGDYIELYGWHNNASPKSISGQNNYCTFERIA